VDAGSTSQELSDIFKNGVIDEIEEHASYGSSATTLNFGTTD
jgi:hypothetical protein